MGANRNYRSRPLAHAQAKAKAASIFERGVEELGMEELGMEELGVEELGMEELGMEELGVELNDAGRPPSGPRRSQPCGNSVGDMAPDVSFTEADSRAHQPEKRGQCEPADPAV